MQSIGQRIRKLRRDLDLTQAELGERAGIDPRNLTRYENDKLRPSVPVLQRIASALSVAVDDLVESERPAETPLRDPELLHQLQAIEQMEPADRDALKRVIQAMILKTQIQGLAKSAS
jgi:transcriptional regulator with XRE-family HTH domain